MVAHSKNPKNPKKTVCFRSSESFWNSHSKNPEQEEPFFKSSFWDSSRSKQQNRSVVLLASRRTPRTASFCGFRRTRSRTAGLPTHGAFQKNPSSRMVRSRRESGSSSFLLLEVLLPAVLVFAEEPLGVLQPCRSGVRFLKNPKNRSSLVFKKLKNRFFSFCGFRRTRRTPKRQGCP